MIPKRRILKTFFLTSVVTVLLFVVFLPFLCDTYLLPHLLDSLPFNQKEYSLSRISPWKIRGTLRLMQDDALVAAIPRFEIQYSPSSLLKGKIDTVLLDAPTVHLQYTDGALSVSGLPDTTRSTKKQGNATSFELPVSIKNIHIRNAHLALETESGLNDIVLDSQIELGFAPKKGKTHKLSTISTTLSTRGAVTLTASTKGVFSPQGILFHTECNIPNLMDIGNFIPPGQGMVPAGSFAAKGQVAIDVNKQLSHFLVNADIDKLKSSFDQFFFTQTAVDTPIHLQLEGNQNTFAYTLSGLSLQEPEQIDLKGSGTIDVIKKEFTGKATAYSKRLDHPFAINMNGRYPSGEFLAHLQVEGAPFSIDEDTSAGPLKLHGDLTYKNEHLTAHITGNIASVASTTKDLVLNQINWNIPLHFPLQELQSSKHGQFNIGSIDYKNNKTASVSTDLQQCRDGFKYTTDIISTMDIAGQMRCYGSVFFDGSISTACTLTETDIDSSLLPNYIKIPDGNSFTGTLTAEATFEVKEKKQAGKLNIHLTKGVFSSGETMIKGIETSISFPDLPHVVSAPGQMATIDVIDSGKIQVQNGTIYFRIENEHQLFLEKARLNWCGGKIEMGSLSLSSDMKKIETTLYCDRLGFAELLQQFGIENTEGQGSLNGRIPVKISDRGILFDDGFLFSTPGNSGIVRFNNTDQLRQGMPDIGQTATLDYSITALKNFAYNWTKLSFNTEGEDLLLAMELDGKPAEPLPFGYKNGQIVATEQGPGLQHPIRLDMNFRLPLQNLFQYGKSLQSLMEKM